MERNVSNLKLTSIYVKYITVTLACIDIIHTTFSYFNIDAFCLSILSGMSILTFILLYLLSYAFKFCAYHRIPLHYMVNYLEKQSCDFKSEKRKDSTLCIKY